MGVPGALRCEGGGQSPPAPPARLLFEPRRLPHAQIPADAGFKCAGDVANAPYRTEPVDKVDAAAR